MRNRRQIRWVGPLEMFTPVLTEKPLEEIWHHLEFFTAEQTLLKNHIPPIREDLVGYACESMVQAEEYMKSSLTSGEHIRPLLVYYSIHNLAKSVLTISRNQKSASYHGLKKVEIPVDGDILQVSASVDAGVFSDLLDLHEIPWEKNMRVTLGSMMKCSAYLEREWRMGCGEQSHVVFPRFRAPIDLSGLDLNIPLLDVERSDWQTLLPALANHFEFSDMDGSGIWLSLKQGVSCRTQEEIHKILADVVEFSVYTSPPYFMLPTTAEFRWRQEAFLYAMSFMLGSIVRYYPDFWSKQVIANRRNRWIANRACGVIERVFPNLMLNTLMGEKLIRFGTSF